MSTDALDARLAAADPARGIEPDHHVAEALLQQVMRTPVANARRAPALRRRRGLALVIALALVLAAAALAAAGLIRLGSPARPSGLLRNPTHGLGALAPGTERLLPLATADPSGGPQWGMRVLSTTRGVGCIEIGRLRDHRLGVIGSDGAFGNDGRFHELPAGGLADGGTCADLDAAGRLFDTVSAFAVPVSGWQGAGACRPPLLMGTPVPPPSGVDCRLADLRDLYYGLLGPRAVSLTYALGGRAHTITPAGPEGAYLIVTRFANPRRPFLAGGRADSLMPRPWSSPIVSVAYDDGTVCRIADTRPVTLKGQCTPPGYRPLRPAVPRHVAAAIHIRVVSVPVRGRSAHRTRRAIRVSFRAPVAITSAASSYELVEDAASPEAAFVATQGDVAAGQTISWLLPASTPGIYSGRIVLGLHGAPPYPIYTYAPGPLVGRFRIRVSMR